MLSDNPNKHEDNMYNKIDDILSYMARLAAKIQASEQMTTHIRDGLVNKNLVDLPMSISDIEKAELDRTMANSYHTFILEFQTEADFRRPAWANKRCAPTARIQSCGLFYK